MNWGPARQATPWQGSATRGSAQEDVVPVVHLGGHLGVVRHVAASEVRRLAWACRCKPLGANKQHARTRTQHVVLSFLKTPICVKAPTMRGGGACLIRSYMYGAATPSALPSLDLAGLVEPSAPLARPAQLARS